MDGYMEKLREWEREWWDHLPRHIFEALQSLGRMRQPLTLANMMTRIARNEQTFLVTKAAKDLMHRLGYGNG